MKNLREIRQNLHLDRVHSKLLYLQASSNYTILHFSNGRSEISGYTLQVYQKMLESFPSFKRIHRSHIVNMNYVKRVRSKKSVISLLDGTELKISRRSKALVE